MNVPATAARVLATGLLTSVVVGASAGAASAHNPGKPGEYGKEKYQTNCADGTGTVRPVGRMFPAINKPDTRIVQTGKTVTNRDGKHFHVVNVQKLRKGKWVTVATRQTVPCGVTKVTRTLAGVAWKLRTTAAPAPTATDLGLDGSRWTSEQP